MPSMGSVFLTGCKQSVKWNVYGHHKSFDIYYLTQTISSQKLHGCNKLNYNLHTVHLYARLNAVNSTMWIHHVLSLLSGTQSYEFTSMAFFHQIEIKQRYMKLSQGSFVFGSRLVFEWCATITIILQNWFPEVIQAMNIGWKKRNDSCWCVSVFQSLTTSSHHKRERQWDRQSERMRQRDRRREGREGQSCCDSLFTPYEWRFSSPSAFFGTSKRQSQQSDLALLLCESWIFIRVFIFLEGWDFAVDMQGSHTYIDIIYT